MQFDLNRSLEILQRTPAVLEAMLGGLSAEWTATSEGPGTWSPFDVVGHLIHGEKTDWILRMEIILSTDADKSFPPFDRFAQYEESKGKSLSQLLEEFKTLRAGCIEVLRSKNLTDADLSRRGIHPVLGSVTLRHLLSTWVVHDLNHIVQISRVMAKQYKEEVGPWTAFLKVLE